MSHFPPPGSTRDQYIGDRLLGVGGAFLVLNTVFVTLRVWSRRLQNPKLRFDDYLVFAAYILIVGLVVDCICAVKLGDVGYHLWDVTRPKVVQWLKTTYLAGPVLYAWAGCIAKMAILWVYLGVFIDKFSRYTCYVLFVVLTLTPFVSMFSIIFQCTPVYFLWDKSVKGGHCINAGLMYRYGSLPHIVTDLFMLLLPIPMIMKLQTSNKVKLGLLATFIAGSIGLVFSIIRFVGFFTPIVDGTWAAVNLLIWCILESSAYLIASCLLAYRPLLKHIFKGTSLSAVFSRVTGNRSHKGSNLSASIGGSWKQKSLTKGSSADRTSEEGLAGRPVYAESLDTISDRGHDYYATTKFPHQIHTRTEAVSLEPLPRRV